MPEYVLADMVICGTLCFFIGLWSGMILAAWIRANEPCDQHMTVQEARKVIREDTPEGSVAARLDALDVAKEVLGPDMGMKEVYKWAEGKNED